MHGAVTAGVPGCQEGNYKVGAFRRRDSRAEMVRTLEQNAKVGPQLSLLERPKTTPHQKESDGGGKAGERVNCDCAKSLQLNEAHTVWFERLKTALALNR